MPRTSIIIPVYNTEKYLDECLASIARQTFTDFECIMVDDGSKDGSAEICQRYASDDPRFIYIYKENGGVSSARNRGLDAAHGEWVSFVDADDWIEEDYLQTIFDLEPKADITFFGETSVETEGRKTQKIPDALYASIREEVEKTIYYLHYGNLGDVFGWTWDKILRRSIIEAHNIRFAENITFREDEIFTLEYCRYISSLRTIDKALYNYRVVEGGLTKKGLQKTDLMPSSRHMIEDLQYYTHPGLCEHILKSATDYRAMNIYAAPLSQLTSLLHDYIEMTTRHPQPNRECRVNHLTNYLKKGYWAGYLYSLMRKL